LRYEGANCGSGNGQFRDQLASAQTDRDLDVTGARSELQLLDNLRAEGWVLSRDEVARLDAVSAAPAHRMFPELLNPLA
jgi:aryl-alcohol dehydrogenase-like predicted oxidoreductase